MTPTVQERRHIGSPSVAAAIGVLLLALAGCRTPNRTPPLTPPAPPASHLSSLPMTNAPASAPRTLEEAVRHALLGHPRLIMLATQAGRARGDRAAAGAWPSPEVRFGTGEGEATSEGWSFQRETGNSTERGSSEQTSLRLEPAEWPRVSRSRETSSSRTRSSEETAAEDVQTRSEDGFSLGLRYEPPNPWLMVAEVGAARAKEAYETCRLLEERHRLACDIVAAAARVGHQQRIVRLWRQYASECDALSPRVAAAATAGYIPQEDTIDMRLRHTASRTGLQRAETKLRDAQFEFEELTGLPADEVILGPLRAGRILRTPLAVTPDGIAELAQSRADVRAAGWVVSQCRGEWHAARAKRMPWVRALEFEYDWWDDERTSRQDFSKTSSSSTTSSEESFERTFPTQTRQWQSSEGSETEPGTSSGFENGGETSDGDSWWVSVGVEVPIFEWLSSETPLRRQTAREARHAYEDARQRATREIRTAQDNWTRARPQLDQERRRTAADITELRAMADQLRRGGLIGEFEALRVRERILEAASSYVEQSLRVADMEIHLCRVAGVVPGEPFPEVAGTGTSAPPAPAPSP